MLLLALGDAYIPDRAIDIPLKFKNLLSIPDKISHIALLGNSTNSREFLEFLTQISPDISIVRGEFDSPRIEIPKPKSKEINTENDNDNKNEGVNENNLRELPLTSIIKAGNFKIGCCSGYTVVPKNDPVSLSILARQLDVDVLLWGGTHNVEAFTLDGKFFVNPGSCTGAFNSDWPVMNDLSEQVNAAQQVTESESKQVEDNKSEEFRKVDDATTNSEMVCDKKQVKMKEEDMDIPDSVVTGSNVPSFCLLDIQGSTCTLYIYLFLDGDVRVDKVVFQKDTKMEGSDGQ